MTLEEMMEHPDSPETDAIMRRLLKSLYEIAARDKGYELESVTIYKKGELPQEDDRNARKSAAFRTSTPESGKGDRDDYPSLPL